MSDIYHRCWLSSIKAQSQAYYAADSPLTNILRLFYLERKWALITLCQACFKADLFHESGSWLCQLFTCRLFIHESIIPEVTHKLINFNASCFMHQNKAQSGCCLSGVLRPWLSKTIAGNWIEAEEEIGGTCIHFDVRWSCSSKLNWRTLLGQGLWVRLNSSLRMPDMVIRPCLALKQCPISCTSI